jgi:hypothetical protein
VSLILNDENLDLAGNDGMCIMCCLRPAVQKSSGMLRTRSALHSAAGLTADALHHVLPSKDLPRSRLMSQKHVGVAPAQ